MLAAIPRRLFGASTAYLTGRNAAGRADLGARAACSRAGCTNALRSAGAVLRALCQACNEDSITDIDYLIKRLYHDAGSRGPAGLRRRAIPRVSDGLRRKVGEKLQIQMETLYQRSLVPFTARMSGPSSARLPVGSAFLMPCLAACTLWCLGWNKVAHGNPVRCSCCGRDTMFSLRCPVNASKR